MKPEVEFNWWIEPEHILIEGNVMASGDDEADREQEQWVHDQLMAGNEAAWCMAFVHAEFEFRLEDGYEPVGFEGRALVGGMSWESERQLWNDNLQDMKAEALADLFKQLHSVVKDGFHPMRLAVRATKNDLDRLSVTLDWMLENEGAILAPKRGEPK